MKKYCKYLFLNLLLIICQINTASALDDKIKSAQDYFYKAYELHELGKYEQALEAYNKAIELDPNNHIIQKNKQILLKTMKYK